MSKIILKVKKDFQFINFLCCSFKALFILPESTQQTTDAIKNKCPKCKMESGQWLSLGCMIYGLKA